jgi:hypothetical protein
VVANPVIVFMGEHCDSTTSLELEVRGLETFEKKSFYSHIIANTHILHQKPIEGATFPDKSLPNGATSHARQYQQLCRESLPGRQKKFYSAVIAAYQI